MTTSNDGPVVSNWHTATDAISIKTKPQVEVAQEYHNLPLFRGLVPLVADDSTTCLNSSYAPPSNLIVHETMSRYLSESLYDTLPKPKWQAAVEDTRTLIARYIKADSSEIAFTRDTTE